ncbi:hypothetical protein B0H13DRAFT_1857578 [Mycena leptocephala]|nr:hypothetical protein B0H13DRAFT_1857578 [Mycena leptocephala]
MCTCEDGWNIKGLCGFKLQPGWSGDATGGIAGIDTKKRTERLVANNDTARVLPGAAALIARAVTVQRGVEEHGHNLVARLRKESPLLLLEVRARSPGRISKQGARRGTLPSGRGRWAAWGTVIASCQYRGENQETVVGTIRRMGVDIRLDQNRTGSRGTAGTRALAERDSRTEYCRCRRIWGDYQKFRIQMYIKYAPQL